MKLIYISPGSQIDIKGKNKSQDEAHLHQPRTPKSTVREKNKSQDEVGFSSK
jgi:hypothetical protein